MKPQKIDWSYLFKHWIFNLLIGPVVSQIIAFIPVLGFNPSFGLLEFYPILLIVSLIFSIPTYIVYAFVYYYFSTKDLPILFSKAILILITAIGVFITTAFIGGTLSNFITISYLISSIITGSIFNLNFKHEERS